VSLEDGTLGLHVYMSRACHIYICHACAYHVMDSHSVVVIGADLSGSQSEFDPTIRKWYVNCSLSWRGKANFFRFTCWNFDVHIRTSGKGDKTATTYSGVCNYVSRYALVEFNRTLTISRILGRHRRS
jgi:hypothetical protein